MSGPFRRRLREETEKLPTGYRQNLNGNMPSGKRWRFPLTSSALSQHSQALRRAMKGSFGETEDLFIVEEESSASPRQGQVGTAGEHDM